VNAADHGHHGPCDRRIEVYAETSASHAYDATLRMLAADWATKTTSGTLGRGCAKLLKGRARLEYLRKHREPGPRVATPALRPDWMRRSASGRRSPSHPRAGLFRDERRVRE